MLNRVTIDRAVVVLEIALPKMKKLTVVTLEMAFRLVIRLSVY
jgi:hypothetical protein